MTSHPNAQAWPFAGPWVLSGNTAKVKVTQAIQHLVETKPNLEILDIGCVGPFPLQFWEPLIRPGTTFRLTGVDVYGIEQAQRVIAKQGWESQVTLRQGSGYNLAELFPANSFDVVVATQVLEHVAKLPHFMGQVAAVLKKDGEVFFTLDSAHWRAPFEFKSPLRSAKNAVKKGLSLLGNETHYDLPWFDHQVEQIGKQAGLQVMEIGYYNLAPLKTLHNKIVSVEQRNDLMRLWLELEDWLNRQKEVRLKARHMFLCMYAHLKKG